MVPEFIEMHGIEKSHYVCMASTKEFQIGKYSKREWVKQHLAGCSDITKAFANWMERDARYAKIVVRSAKDYGMNVLIVDGRKSIKEKLHQSQTIISSGIAQPAWPAGRIRDTDGTGPANSGLPASRLPKE